MKRGFRYLFNQEKLDDKDDDLDMGIEQKRGFFQKFFRPTSSRSLGGVEGTSTEHEGKSLLDDNDDYAVIDKRQDGFVISINKDKREMSAPLSPKSVTFEDELSSIDRRGQSVAPNAAFLANSIGITSPMQQTFNNFNYDTSHISTINSNRDIQLTPARSSLSDREHFSPISSSHEASLALDEATHDLLRLSSQPPSVWYSSSSRLLPAADRIPKSASTTSMNKIIRTEDGGMLKLSNAFTWDTARLSNHNHDSSHNSAYVDDKGRRHQTVTIYDEKRQGPPIVRTTVEGKLKMEKVVGADLISVEHCTCSAWTIRDVVTHYKVKTTLGKRTLIMEEDKSMNGQKGDFKMSLYEYGQLKTRDVADLQIPSNVDKGKYLSQLSQRLLHDIEMLDQREEPKITTRVEVEITENVTKILKTYIVGERNDLFLSIDQTATDAATDAIRPSSDFKFLFEGHQYEDRSEIRPYQRADSDATTTTESSAQRHLPPICINVECNLTRMEDHSLNEVNVQLPNVFSVVLSLIRERIPQQLSSLVKYGMQQHGKQYSGETTIRRLHRYDSTESSDELQTTMMQAQKERTFFFEKPEKIEPVKIPVLNITELDLRRMADTSAILANFAIPRTDQSKLNIEHRYEFHEARGGSYGMRQQGQHFEGEMILRKKRRFSLESESVSEEEVISGPTYLNLIKQEARGEFEVAIVLSNDERSSPKHFQESQSAETINLIAQMSTDGKKEEVFAIFVAKNKCKQVYMGQEIGIVTSNVMITMQKAIHLDDIFQQIIQRWNDKTIERIAMKLSEFNEEQQQIFLKFESSIVAYQEAYYIHAIPRLLKQNEITIAEFGNVKEHVAVMLQRAGIMYGQVQREWPEAVTDNRYETISSSIHESGSEHQQYMAHWDVSQNAISAEMYVAVAELQSMACTVDAIKQEEVQIVKQIEHPEFSEFTNKMISLKPFASEIGEWKIVQGNTEAVFQQSDEQMAEEAINIIDRYSEKQIGAFQEYGSISMETIAHFARILLKKAENYEAKISNNISRHWEECLSLKASRECIGNLEQSLIEVEPIEIARRTMNEVNRAKVIIDLIASSEAYAGCAIMLDKQSQYESQKIVLKEINREWIISERYIVQSEIAKRIDTTWSTVVNDFDSAINIYECNREQVMLDTAASQELQLESRNTLCMKSSYENASIYFPTITAISGGERQFKIESEMKESILARKQEALFAENVQKAIFRAENLTESVMESSEVQSDAGVLLMRHSAKKTSEATSHIINIALTLSQHLKTQHAQETSKEASVEFSIPASNLEVEDNIRESVINRGTVSLETKYAKAIALQETVELIKSRKVLAEAESILKGARTDAVSEKLKETDSEGFEILSQWTIVDRDLEAEVRLQHARNIVSIFSTIATTEEEISISQTWEATECNSKINTIRNIIASEYCQRNFQIEFDEMRIQLEKSEEEGNYEIIWCDKNYDMLYVSLHESILEKLSAVINLHRISSILPKQRANEYIWQDQQFIAAIPLHIKCEDIETNYTNVDICLKQKVAQKYLETVRISANWMAEEIFECEQAGDEKFYMLVEFEGKRLIPLGVEIIWPEARKDDSIMVDVEEYLEDQAILYAQLTSEQVTFAEFSTTVTISQEYEPQMLTTNSTKEEIVNAYDEFRISSEAIAINHVLIIGNKGEYLSVWLQETKQDFVIIGFQYSNEVQAYEVEGNFVEKRFGGNYQLITKATKTEDRNASMAMLRRIENETVREVLKENVKNFASMEVLASTSKATLIEINWQKAQQMQTASTQLPCSRKAEPIRSCFLEIGETMHTVYAQFKIKESSWKLPIIWKIPNYGGHLTLNTESTEETLAYHEIDYHKDEAFEIIIKTLKEVVTVIAPVLSAQHITEVMQEIRTDLVRPSVNDEAHFFLKQANKGINIEVKLIETTDVRQTSYLQFAREVESIELEKIIREARFGGKLNFITCAAEESELNAVRELTSSSIRIAHCSQLIISKNWNRGTYCETIATISESADVPVILRSIENTDDTYCTIHQKAFMRNALTIQESEVLVLIINLNYIKERAKEISEKTIWLTRNAEPCILATFAATEEQKLVQWIVEKRRDTFLSASTIIKMKNIVKALPLNTIQSETAEITICPNLQRIARMLEVCKTLMAPNRGYDMVCKLHETCDENEFSNYQFKQENMVERIEAILPESCYGGHSILNTSAMKESMVDLILRLESKLSTEAEIYFTTNISNKSIPIVFSTKSAVSVENNETIALERKLETNDVAITQKIANINTVEMNVREISLETESIILQYQHKEEHIEIQKIIFIALYGGHQKLETLATSEMIANIYEDLIAKHLMFAEACLHQIIANVASPCILSVQSSKLEESNEEYCLQKKLISESGTVLVLRIANYEFAKFITAESTDEIETITTHWQHDETYEEAQLCMRDKLFGGSVLLSTHFAHDFAIIFTAALSASHSTLERVIFAIPIARYSMEHPILATSCTTEMHTEISCNLNRPLIGHQSTITIQIANQIEPVIIELTESTIISEITNIQYQRPNAVFGAFSEVFPEIRFGGSLILNTLATKETMINIQSSLSSQSSKQLEMQIIIMDKNRATEMYHMLASTEKTIVISIQFQKASDLSSVETTKRASRRGEDRCITLTELTEINEFSNFLWERPAETSAGQVIILKEMRFGGRLELNTKHTGEETTTITDTLTRNLAKLDSTISRKAVNRGESISISCPASQENYISINLELQSKKLAQFEVSVRREAANCEEPQKLITNEFSELMLATNVTMQKTLDYESIQTMWKAKNESGIIELRCNASKESYVELYNCLESRLSLKQHLGVTLTKREIRYGEHIAMNLMATEETIFNFEVSFEKQDMESNNNRTIKAMNIALPEMLETKESLESAIEIERVEVWRRVSAVHVESALKLARECLPVSLQTDSAQETFIKHEAEMRVDVQRTDDKVEIEKSANILEHEALVCAEAVNVTLRHKSVDEGQEEKVEKRVSFAAEVTERTMSMDMSVTVEEREIPMIVKKPMKKEQHGRRPTLRQNEAPNFIPVRRNSLLLAMELGDSHNIPHYKTLEDVIKGIKKAGLEYSNLIFGIDYTKSNKYQGERTFDGRNLHALNSEEMNPYQQVIEIVGKTLSSFDADGVIPTYGFGDEESSDIGIFNLSDRNDINAGCIGFEEVLKIYNEKTPLIRMSGPTNFVPLIEQAISIVREKHSYHILVIVADGQVTNEKINQKAIAAASRYPLSIIMVGVGDGPWNMMTRFDETLPKRMFDNFHFVDFHKVMFNAPNQEASFALNALMEIPDQYKAIKELGLLKQSRRG